MLSCVRSYKDKKKILSMYKDYDSFESTEDGLRYISLISTLLGDCYVTRRTNEIRSSRTHNPRVWNVEEELLFF